MISNRRIVGLAVMVLAGCLLLLPVYLAVREAPEIRRSHAIKIGMTASEVEGIMGAPEYLWERSNDGSGIYFGRSLTLRFQICWLLGLEPAFGIEDYPVRIRFDADGRVIRIERGNDVEEVPSVSSFKQAGPSTEPSPDSSPRRSNQQVAQAVADALRGAELEGKSISIEVLSGACTLTGMIRDDEQRTAAERIVSSVAGVDSVNNKLVLMTTENRDDP